MTYCNACGQPVTRYDHEFHCRIARAIRYGEASPLHVEVPAIEAERQPKESAPQWADEYDTAA